MTFPVSVLPSAGLAHVTPFLTGVACHQKGLALCRTEVGSEDGAEAAGQTRALARQVRLRLEALHREK
jgi:hypothetical protein